MKTTIANSNRPTLAVLKMKLIYHADVARQDLVLKCGAPFSIGIMPRHAFETRTLDHEKFGVERGAALRRLSHIPAATDYSANEAPLFPGCGT
jgi:hypothetical protein